MFAVAGAALGYLGVSAEVHPAYITGCSAMVALSVVALCFEWRKAYQKLTDAKNRLCVRLGRLTTVFAGLAALLGIVAVALYLKDTAVTQTLIQEKPWAVEYGDILNDERNRIYVHARFRDTAVGPVTFQVYGKSLLEPSSLRPAQSEKISDELQDDVRRLASGDDAPVLTANADAKNPTEVDLPGPVIAKSAFHEWQVGKKVIYYAALVYIKDDDGARLRFKDCEITRAVTKRTSAGDIPGLGAIWVKYPWSEEIPCDKTGKQ